MGKLDQLMKQAQQMQAQMAAIQKELAESSFSGQAGGGLVTVTLKGSMELEEVKIAPQALEGGDAEMLEDLLMAAFRAAQDAVRKASEEKLGPMTRGLGLPGF